MLASLLEKLQALTPKQRYISFSGVVMVLLVAFIWQVFIPKNKVIRQMREEVSALNNDINIRRTKARRLEALRAEYVVLRKQLVELETHLPSESEVDILLKQVSNLGEENGLLVKLWKPEPRKQNASGIYTEIPMRVEVNGGYHSVGAFFEKISELPRIITISSIKMGSATRDHDRFAIETSFLATTFSVIQKTEASSTPPG
ncbi:MAG: type 4a pilus biogenesis protein PilO [Nitrospirae bacterium]|nr:type 4a pilus biogenesis protein PilO [Candidatus Troglogloeales bacterium]